VPVTRGRVTLTKKVFHFEKPKGECLGNSPKARDSHKEGSPQREQIPVLISGIIASCQIFPDFTVEVRPAVSSGRRGL